MGRPKKPRKTPKWQARIDKMSSWHAVVIAALVQPWPLLAAAAAIVVEAKLSSAETYISLFLFCLIATSSVLVIEIHAVFRPERSHALLACIKAWIDTLLDRVLHQQMVKQIAALLPDDRIRMAQAHPDRRHGIPAAVERMTIGRTGPRRATKSVHHAFVALTPGLTARNPA